MDETGVMPLALRVERGRADDDELAAVAVVLCSVLAGRAEAARRREPVAARGGAGSPGLPYRAGRAALAEMGGALAAERRVLVRMAQAPERAA
jgi:hypothetical protein